jgi:ribosome recycling factor
MMNDILKDTESRMSKTIEAVSKELGAVRTGKASTHLLDSVKVETYGTTMPLSQLAGISAPEARLLVVQAYDKGTVGDIVKGIHKADLGLNPSVDGQTIRLAVPPLNEERRRELVRHCKHLAEDGRVAIRNIRRDANEQIKKAEKDKHISEDQAADGRDEIQKLTDGYINTVDELVERKEAEVMEV